MTADRQQLRPEGRFTGRGAAAGMLGIACGLAAATGGLAMTLAVSLAGIWAGIAAMRGAPRERLEPGLTWMLALAFWVWLCATLIWSPTGWQDEAASLVGVLVLGPLAAWACAGNGEDRTIARRAAIAAFAVAAFVLLLEALSHYRIFAGATPGQDPKETERNLGRGAAVCMMLVWPACACLWRLGRGRVWIAGLAGVAALVSAQFGIDLNMAAFALGGLAAGLALAWPRLVTGALFTAVTLAVATAPLAYPALARLGERLAGEGGLPLSYLRRAQMWDFTVARIAEKPWAGWGLGAARTFDAPVEVGGYMWTTLQSHPHSAPLQVWLEAGAIGAALGCAALIAGGVWCATRIARDRVAAAALCGGLTAVALGFALSYGAWQEWLWASAAAVVGFSVASAGMPVRHRAAGAA